MAYSELPDYAKLTRDIELLAQLKAEHGASGMSPILKDAGKALQDAIRALEDLPEDKGLAQKEPNELAAIKIHSYLIGHDTFSISELLQRFAHQAEIVWGTK